VTRTIAVLVFIAVLASASGAEAPCSDPIAVLKTFYDLNDAHHFDASAAYLADDALFATWATGVQGYVMVKRSLNGKAAIRKYLAAARGVGWHLPDSPSDGPIYHLTRTSVRGDIVQFMLVPDRKRPSGRSYNPFKVEARVSACRIVSLTVIEEVTWL
jgi:hypothetical protein